VPRDEVREPAEDELDALRPLLIDRGVRHDVAAAKPGDHGNHREGWYMTTAGGQFRQVYADELFGNREADDYLALDQGRRPRLPSQPRGAPPVSGRR